MFVVKAFWYTKVKNLNKNIYFDFEPINLCVLRAVNS